MSNDMGNEILIAGRGGQVNTEAMLARQRTREAEISIKPAEPETPKEAVTEAVERVATAGMGALIAEAIDFIEDSAERTKVGNEIHRWDEEYKNDPFKDDSYGELRTILTTGERGGKKLSDEEIVQARASRRLRVKEAERYGVMGRAEGILKSRLIEADWNDYPSKIADAASAAEIMADGFNVYRYNPRIQGVVGDAVAATEPLTRGDGYRRISDLNITGNREMWEKKVHVPASEIENEKTKTQEEIRERVFWDPFPGRYAGYVNTETPRQEEIRLENEKLAVASQRELALAEVKVKEAQAAAEAAARAKIETGGLLGSPGVKRDEARESLIPESEQIFDKEFLTAHDLPEHIIVPPFIKGYGIEEVWDTRFLLKQMYEKGVSPQQLSESNIANSLMEILAASKKIPVKDLSKEDVEKINTKASKAFKQLSEGLAPLMSVRRNDGGTFTGLAGNPDSVDQKVHAGALIGAGFDLKDTVVAFGNDNKAKQVLGVWLSLFGAEVAHVDFGGIDANKYKTEIAEMMSQDHKELTRDQAVAIMDTIAKEMASKLEVGIGSVNLMRELANLLVPGPDMQGYRKLLKTQPMLRQIKDELASRPILEKIFYAGKPMYLFEGLKNGVGELFRRIGQLDNGNLQIYFKGMKGLQDNMDDIESMVGPDKKGGALSSKNKEEYLGKIGDFLKKLTEGDPPLIKIETAGVILKEAQEKWGTLEAGSLASKGQLKPEEIAERANAIYGPRISNPKFLWAVIRGLFGF